MEPLKDKSRKLKQLVRAPNVGEPISHTNLTLVPFRGEQRGELDYSLAAEAIEAGKLVISKVDPLGRVSELTAANESDQMILLLDGEELLGAKQNRILNTSILLRPRSRTKIPVSCVEAGRWHLVSRQFKGGQRSPSTLRARMSHHVTQTLQRIGVAHGNQNEVWDSVAENILCCSAFPNEHNRRRGGSYGARIVPPSWRRDRNNELPDGVFD